jgi:maltooligosyltrehalose trehalohydrolase
MKAGSFYKDDSGCTFCVWAPLQERMILHIVHPEERKIEMTKDKAGYFKVTTLNALPGCRYFFMPDQAVDYPDPASHYQPLGITGPSEVVDHTLFPWEDTPWHGLPFTDLILYELHVGTFTPEGTFEAIIGRLDDLLAIGINAIQLMPVSQFSGTRNWGYDGVFPYAVQHSYGGPEGLKKLVNACHQKGIAVLLDVVYNHFGPEGNVMKNFGPYFTDQYKTPWGEAINFDREYADGVRDFFLCNAVYWFEEYHLDGLRLDAIHAVYDTSAVPFWQLLTTTVNHCQQRLGRPLHLIAESDLNSPHVIHPAETGGLGFTAQWLDDFHHSLYVLLYEKGKILYEDYGRMEQLAKAYTDGFVLSGEYVAFRKRKFGASSAGIPGNRFVAFIDNHDQAGNRPMGERLSMLVDFRRLKLAAAALLLSPYIPLLFMGEEYGETNPFFFFSSFEDPQLVEAVRKGRKEQLQRYHYDEELSDPQDEATFQKSKLNWALRKEGVHRVLLAWYRRLIELRTTKEELKNFQKNDTHVYTIGQSGFVLHRQWEGGMQHTLVLFNLSEENLAYSLPPFSGTWNLILDSETYNDEKKSLPQVSAHAGEQVTMVPLSVTVYSDN